MIEEFKNQGKFITFTILPVAKTVSFVVFSEKEVFYDIANKHNGLTQQNDIAKLTHDSLFYIRFPTYDFSEKAKFFKLNNGAIAVDQSLSRMGNPYYICSSFEDYELITKYLVVFKDEESKKPMVYCALHNHRLIKTFLKTIDLIQIKDFELAENERLFKAPNGYYIMLTSIPAYSGAQAIFGMHEKIENDEDIYVGLAIYESLELMRYLGELDPDE